jgi:hypothetical protein
METSNRQFGLVVAYVLPGFIALGGFALFVPDVAAWLRVVEGTSGIAASVYTLLAATALGMIVSCFRWLLIDHALALTGLNAPVWTLDGLQDRLAALDYFVEYHYRYYQFYANTLIAAVWTYLLHRWLATSSLLGPWTDLGVVILCAVLFAGARDALQKYYIRTGSLLSDSRRKVR